MNSSRVWLALWAVVCFPLAAVAAPAPVPGPASLGPISDALRLHRMLAGTVAPRAVPAVMVEDGVIGLEYRAMVAVQVKRVVQEMVAETRAETQNVRGADGKVQQVTRFVTKMVPVAREVAVTEVRPAGKAQIRNVPAKACKFFEVSKEGKLKALDTAKATALLKKRTAILTGPSTEVDPRHLTLVRPGTIYLALPRGEPIPLPSKPPLDEKPRP
jgi:hypothetical protein